MEDKLKLNIQMFAEGEDNAFQNGEEEAPVLTFEEILEDEQYRSAFDKKITKATDTAVKNARLKWDEEQKTKQAEADKLAKMDEEQKKSYEVDKITKERDSAVSELNSYKLKDEALKQAREKGVDLELMETLDYTKETAESIKTKIEIFDKASKKIHEHAIEEYSKEPTPQTGDKLPSDSGKTGYEKFEEKYNK